MICEFREDVYDLITGQQLLPTHRYVPTDVAELPCIVVSGVSLEDGEPGLYELTLPLYVVGRRMADDDAQSELDTYADKTLDVLGGTKGRKGLAATSVRPTIVTVGTTDVPSYLFTIATTKRNC